MRKIIRCSYTQFYTHTHKQTHDTHTHIHALHAHTRISPYQWLSEFLGFIVFAYSTLPRAAVPRAGTYPITLTAVFWSFKQKIWKEHAAINYLHPMRPCPLPTVTPLVHWQSGTGPLGTGAAGKAKILSEVVFYGSHNTIFIHQVKYSKVTN